MMILVLLLRVLLSQANFPLFIEANLPPLKTRFYSSLKLLLLYTLMIITGGWELAGLISACRHAGTPRYYTKGPLQWVLCCGALIFLLFFKVRDIFHTRAVIFTSGRQFRTWPSPIWWTHVRRVWSFPDDKLPLSKIGREKKITDLFFYDFSSGMDFFLLLKLNNSVIHILISMLIHSSKNKKSMISIHNKTRSIWKKK